MFYEDEVTSFKELERRLGTLDQDAGVRIITGTGRKRFLLFVSRFGERFTMMAYTMKKGVPGKRLQTLEFDGLASLEAALKKFVKGGLHAWVY